MCAESVAVPSEDEFGGGVEVFGSDGFGVCAFGVCDDFLNVAVEGVFEEVVEDSHGLFGDGDFAVKDLVENSEDVEGEV